MCKTDNTRPESSTEWYDLGLSFRKNGDFGEAVNAFRQSAVKAREELLDGVISREYHDELQQKVQASVELIARIIGFVNKDLMNP